VIRSFRLLSLVALVSTGVAASFVASASAAPKATPAPAASASPAPASSATPEPLDHVISRLEAKMKADPNDKAAAQDLAGAYFQANRPDLTLGITKKLLAGGTKNAQVYYFDGVANAAIGDTKSAVASLEQARNFEPTNAQVLGTLTTIYLRLNQPADAERVAQKAIAFNKDDENAYINYGLVLSAEQKFDEARKQFETAATLNPKDAHPIVLEARSYVDQKAIAFAQQLFDRAIAIDPTSGEALYGKAKLSAAQHNVKDAVTNYEALLKTSTDDNERASIVDEEAALYAAEKMSAEADAAFKRAIASYPGVLGTHIAYGDYLASTKDNAGAEHARVQRQSDGARARRPTGDLAQQVHRSPRRFQEGNGPGSKRPAGPVHARPALHDAEAVREGALGIPHVVRTAEDPRSTRRTRCGRLSGA
jgi:tetratricopeptide (TPR) repeat protein